jgi:hypothetical protein
MAAYVEYDILQSKNFSTAEALRDEMNLRAESSGWQFLGWLKLGPKISDPVWTMVGRVRHGTPAEFNAHSMSFQQDE